MRPFVSAMFADIPKARPKRLTAILDDQLTVAKLNPRAWKHRLPYAVRRKAYDKGVCAICGGIDEHRSLAMDHCHETGVVRGALCMGCNTGLGQFKDNPGLLRKAVAYLEAHCAEVGL